MGRARYWIPLVLLGFAELVLVAVELFDRSAEAAELGARLGPVTGERYEGIFGFAIDGHERLQFLTLDEVARAYAGHAGPLWQYTLIVAFAALALSYARRVRARVVVALVAAAVVGIPLLDLALFSQFGLGAAIRGPLMAALGLALVAWYERSGLILTAAVLSGAVAAVVADLPGVLLAAVVLVAGAFVAVLRREPA